MRSAASRLVLLFAVTAAAVPILPAHAAGYSFRSSGGCAGLSTGVPVDAAAASALVPDGFVVLEPVPGNALLALVIQDCETAIDDGPASRGMLNVAFLFTDPVRSPAGCEMYDLFWTTSRADDWYRSMKTIGVEMGLSRSSALRIEPATVGVSARGTNPYVKAPHSISAEGSGAITPPFPLTSVHCHVGPHGLVRQTYDHQFRAGGGVAEVTLGPSRLWDELGATGGASGALISSFTWTGLTEIVEPTGS